MAGRGPAPRPDAIRRNAPTFEWLRLPRSGRRRPAPDLPTWRPWTEVTSSWWADLWSTPQSCAWDQTGRTLWNLALLHHELVAVDALRDAEKSKAAGISAEMRQHEDRHGLNPKALTGLRWVIVDDDEATENLPGLVTPPDAPPPGKGTRKRAAKKSPAHPLAARLRAVK